MVLLQGLRLSAEEGRRNWESEEGRGRGGGADRVRGRKRREREEEEPAGEGRKERVQRRVRLERRRLCADLL